MLGPKDTGPLPINASIGRLDEAAMRAISFDSVGGKGHRKSAREAYDAFTQYMRDTGNTICGQYPLLLMLSILCVQEEKGIANMCRFTQYKQSGECTDAQKSVVAYASGYVDRVGTE